MYQLSVWIHIIAAAIWTGGLIYTAAVVVPFAVGRGNPERQLILRGLAKRFRPIGWGSIVVLALTGLGNLSFRVTPITLGQLFTGEAFDPRLVDGFIAVWLPWKLLLVVVMIGLMLYHDVTSIRSRPPEGATEDAPRNRGGSKAAALATLVALAVLYVSVRLVRG